MDTTRTSIRSADGKWILSATILASGLGFLTNSAVNIALPTLQRVLETSFAGVQWIANAYLLALSSLILVSGSISDRIGLKRVFCIGIGLFTIGAGLSGAVSSLGGLVGFRAVQGVGGALMVPSSLAVINTTFVREERGRAIGLWAGVSGAVAALGPFVGGFLVDIGWRLVFLAFVPLGVVTLLLALRRVPRRQTESADDGPIDWIGTALVLVALVALSFGLISLPDTGATPATIATIVGGIGAGIGFVIHERRAEKPLVPPDMFDRRVTAANVSTFLLYFGLQGALFLMSFRLQQLSGYSPRAAGLALLPVTILITVLSGPSGTVTDRFGPRPQMIAGPAIVAVAFGVIAVAPRDAGYVPLILVGLSLIGVGMATVIPAVTSAAIEVGPGRSGTASGVNNAIARVAGLAAVVVAGGIQRAVFAARLSIGLDGVDLDAATQRTIEERSGELLAMDLPELAPSVAAAVSAALRTAFAAAFRASILTTAVLAAAAAVVGLSLSRGQRSQTSVSG